jgi:hypothetical protein
MTTEHPDFFATPEGATGIAVAEAVASRLMDPNAANIAEQTRPSFQRAIRQRCDELVAMHATQREEIRMRCVEWHEGTASTPPARPLAYLIALHDAAHDGGPDVTAPPVRLSALLYLIMR